MSRTAASVRTPTTGVTRALAEHAARLDADAIPADIRMVARHCLLDWLGVALAGASDETVRILREEALEQGGTPQATVLGSSLRSSVLQAALVNGTAGHALDYDDVNYAMPGHPTAPVAPALLALAERDGNSGRELLCAFVAGVETECRTGLYMTGEHYERGWHATATIGTLGAAGAAARLLGLDTETTATALGIAATQAAGLKSMFGTMCKPLHAGKAASNGLHAALLAARGFTSRVDALDCAQGFGATQSPAVSAEAALDGIGQRFLTRNVLFKYHAACYGTHATIEAARSLALKQQLDPEEIARVEIRVKPSYLKICNIEQPRTGLEAKFSLSMTCAMALAGEQTGAPERYDEALCGMPTLRLLLDKTRVIPSEDMGHGASEVVVSMSNGVVYRVRGDVSEPAADLNAQGRRLRAKFDTLVTPVLGKVLTAELAEMVEGIDGLEDVRGLLALTRA